jgi:integrase
MSTHTNSLMDAASGEILPTAKPDRKARRIMSRRPGQNGSIERRGNTYNARFWLDVPGVEKRVYKRVRICPVEGPGSLNSFERRRRLREIVLEFGANSEATFREAEAVNLGTTFKEQSEKWLHQVQTRKRNPIKLSTASGWQGYLRYINEQIGSVPLADVNNRSMKDFIAKMATEEKNGEQRFSAKSIASYLGVVKMVVASALNEKDEPLYPIKWNHEVMDLPVIDDQNTPAFTAEEVATILDKAEGSFRILYAVLAGGGLRWGEASALNVEHVKGSVIHVRQSIWNGHLSTPKTKNGTREVDLHSSLADALHDHIGGRTSGYVFQSARGTPLQKSNVLRRSLHPILLEMGTEPRGFHSFRRFRVAHLRKQLIPEILLRMWVGHSTEGITDKYALDGIRRDTLFRTMTAQKAGLGFTLPELHPSEPTCTRSEYQVTA